MANALFTHDDTTKREDLLDILKDVSPNKDNYLYDNFGTSKATNTLHEWLTYNLARPTSENTVAEGADYADDDNSQPVRSNNITAIWRRAVRVTRTERAVKVGLPGDPMDFQKMQALNKLKSDIEYSLMNGVKTSGASGTASGMAGLVGVISTNISAYNSGMTLSTTELEGLMQLSWNAVGSGYVVDTLLVSMLHKRKIATFSTRVTNYVNDTKSAYANVTMYETSSGMVNIVPHKDLIASAGTVHIIGINKDMYKIAWLDTPQWVKVGKTGDADKGFYVGEGTMESLAERTSFKASGYTTTG